MMVCLPTQAQKWVTAICFDHSVFKRRQTFIAINKSVYYAEKNRYFSWDTKVTSKTVIKKKSIVEKFNTYETMYLLFTCLV